MSETMPGREPRMQASGGRARPAPLASWARGNTGAKTTPLASAGGVSFVYGTMVGMDATQAREPGQVYTLRDLLEDNRRVAEQTVSPLTHRTETRHEIDADGNGVAVAHTYRISDHG